MQGHAEDIPLVSSATSKLLAQLVIPLRLLCVPISTAASITLGVLGATPKSRQTTNILPIMYPNPVRSNIW